MVSLCSCTGRDGCRMAAEGARGYGGNPWFPSVRVRRDGCRMAAEGKEVTGEILGSLCSCTGARRLPNAAEGKELRREILVSLCSCTAETAAEWQPKKGGSEEILGVLCSCTGETAAECAPKERRLRRETWFPLYRLPVPNAVSHCVTEGNLVPSVSFTGRGGCRMAASVLSEEIDRKPHARSAPVG